MKINFGCGNRHIEGFLNVDKVPECNPDQVVDMEIFPWPIADNSVEEVKLIHVLEHVGATTDCHMQIIQELYRICRPGAEVQIIVPHPRSENYLGDPTHVRPVSAELFNLYSKSFCEQAIAKGWASTPLALYWKVDFSIKKITHHLMPLWLERYNNKQISDSDITFAVNTYNNVVNEIEIELVINK
ncbi:MAG: hypothetical protein HQK83_16340 [Fibrobacteria bacterium]|nr:hypothetical protein [Fibrobacteria bacterium]